MPEDNQNEQFYLVDKDDVVLGSITRQKAHMSPDFIHRSVQILLFNEKNQILLQKRSKNKDLYPNYWTISASGHVTFGDTYEQAAHRELREEIGVVTTLQYKTKYLEHNERESEFLAVFTGVYNSEPTELDPFEVELVKWVNLEDLPNFVLQNDFTFTGERALRELHLI